MQEFMQKASKKQKMQKKVLDLFVRKVYNYYV